MTMEINKHIGFTAKVDFTNTSNNGYNSSVNPFNYAYSKSRTIPIFNEDGSYYMTYEKSGSIGTESIGYNILKELDNTGNHRSWTISTRCSNWM